MSHATLRTFIAYVEDLPGVLNRVTSLLRRRNYNIVSLTVGRTERAGISRITMVLETDDDGARRIEANLYKLVNVLWVEAASEATTLARELALIKVRADPHARAEILGLCEDFHARVSEIGIGTIVAEITGTGDRIDGLVDALRPFGVLEMVRTGVVAMVCSADGTTDRIPLGSPPTPDDARAA